MARQKLVLPHSLAWPAGEPKNILRDLWSRPRLDRCELSKEPLAGLGPTHILPPNSPRTVIRNHLSRSPRIPTRSPKLPAWRVLDESRPYGSAGRQGGFGERWNLPGGPKLGFRRRRRPGSRSIPLDDRAETYPFSRSPSKFGGNCDRRVPVSLGKSFLITEGK